MEVFNLLALPYVAFSSVLQTMETTDLVNMTRCSNRMSRRVFQSGALSLRRINDEEKKKIDFWTVFRIEELENALRKRGSLRIMTIVGKDILSLNMTFSDGERENRIQIVFKTPLPQNIQPSQTVQMGNQEVFIFNFGSFAYSVHCTNIVDAFTYVFNAAKTQFEVGSTSLNIVFEGAGASTTYKDLSNHVVSVVNNVDFLVVVNLTVEDFEFVSKKIKSASMIISGAEYMSSYPLVSFLRCNYTILSLDKTNYTISDVMTVLRSWINGFEVLLQNMNVELDEKFDLQQIMEEVKKEETSIKKTLDFMNDGMFEIQRNDGKTVRVGSDSNSIYFKW